MLTIVVNEIILLFLILQPAQPSLGSVMSVEIQLNLSRQGCWISSVVKDLGTLQYNLGSFPVDATGMWSPDETAWFLLLTQVSQSVFFLYFRHFSFFFCCMFHVVVSRFILIP